MAKIMDKRINQYDKWINGYKNCKADTTEKN